MTDLSQLKAAVAGRYEVEREVGAGGMATVYLARDVRHDRRVALKVLKPELGAVLGVERFLAEIKVTANLQHPNLLPLFDSGAADGLLFYVMPFVEGESLRARLDREKQLPIDDAVHIAAAVASALDYAHRQGVIHRDLKPENILLHEGQPLVADFGIALAVSNAGGGRITQTGLSLGTPQYMSPEQATGDRAVDGRTDIYSLGAVTYEMLTGEAPHVGSTSQAIIARVITEKPRAIRVSRPNVPAHVEGAVEHALEKLAADRFATAKEFSDALTGRVILATTQATTAAIASESGKFTLRERMMTGALALVGTLLIAAVIVAGKFYERSPDVPEVQFELDLGFSPAIQQISVSPDGRTILSVVGNVVGSAPLFARTLGSTETRKVNGTDGAGMGFWSPDSKYIVFSVGDKLKRVALSGGSPEPVCDLAAGVRGVTWSSEDVLVFSAAGVLYRVAAAGGVPTKLDITLPKRSVRWEHPWFLPDGKHFLVNSHGPGPSDRHLYVASIDGGAPVDVMAAESRVAFVSPGALLFVRDGTLYAQQFDPDALRLSGEPVVIADEVGANLANGNAGFGVSNNGVLAYRRARGGDEGKQLQWYEPGGKALEKVGELSRISEFALSPDGVRVAITRAPEAGGIVDVWILDLTTDITSRLTSDSVGAIGITWAPDSRVVAYGAQLSSAGGSRRISARAIGGLTDSLIYSSDSIAAYPEDYLPDGSLLVRRPDSVLVFTRGGGRSAVSTPESVDEMRVSPDGRHVSYGSRSSNRWEVYVASYPGFGHRQQVSANGGVQARWRGDGRELFFIGRPDGKVMVASVKAGPTLEFNAPTELFQSPQLNPNPVIDQFDVTSDGKRFLFAVDPRKGPDREIPPIVVVLNWSNALKRQ